jgi:hypothetical protein
LQIIADTTEDSVSTISNWPANLPLTLVVTLNLSDDDNIATGTLLPMAADIFGFGFIDDGVEKTERVSNQIIRLELEETGDNTSTFEGTLEYTMVNQLNVLDAATYENISPIADDPTFIVFEDLDDEESPRVNYLDLGADGVSTQVSDQEEAPSHSGIISFDNDSYKIADTVTITLEDADLNVDVDLIDIYTVVDGALFDDPARDTVGDALGDEFTYSFGPLGRLLDVTFDDQPWQLATPESNCKVLPGTDSGLGGSGFSLIETSTESGIFTGDFQIPTNLCRPGASAPETATGLDIEVNYVDFRDASGEIIEVGDSAGVRANTGSVSLDRTVYPVPFGVPDNFGDLTGETSPDNKSIFAIHATGINGDLTDSGTYLPNGDLTIHVRVNDPDFDVSASGEDTIAFEDADGLGPVKISVIRGSETVILGYAGGFTEDLDGRINVSDNLLGNGSIESEELTIPANSGFDNTITEVTLTQSGSSTTADWNDVAGQLDVSGELSDIVSEGGLKSQAVLIVGLTSTEEADGEFTDKNNNGKVDAGEITQKDDTQFDDTEDVEIIGLERGDTDDEIIATATFTDNPSVDADELSNFGEGNAGFVSGTVQITQDGASVNAQFKDSPDVKSFGPIDEIAPDAGIFEIDVTIQYTDGPSSSICPETVDFDANTDVVDDESDRFNVPSDSGENYCILQGDILQVEYKDPADASGDINTVTDSATFDLRNGVLHPINPCILLDPI